MSKLQREIPGGPWRMVCPSEATHPPVANGLRGLRTALKDAGIPILGSSDPPAGRIEGEICVSLATDPGASEHLHRVGQSLPEKAESFVIAAIPGAGESHTLAIVGCDGVGAMYGCFELADRLRLDGRPALSPSQPIVREPYATFRAINPYITLPYKAGGETWDSWWFLSDEFWEGYLDQLARSRFNWIDLHGMYDVVATTFPNIYPYFIHSDRFPEAGIEPDRAARHLAMLRKVGKMAADRGIRIALMSYSTQFGPDTRPNSFDWNEENLAAYNRECIETLLAACPNIDMIGFRIGESGQSEDFYKKCYVPAVKACGRDIQVSTRTWGALKTKVVELAREFPGRLVAEIKYNGEQLGPPHLLAGGRMAVWRDYSFQNYFSEPRPYRVIYQVRLNGTHRVFPTANPDLIRITVENAKLGPADGISVEPINTYYPARNFQAKSGSPGEWYRWVYQRDWFFYQCWGRIAYDPSTPDRVWIDQFQRRNGKEAGETFYRAITTASEIVPRVFTFAGMHPDHRGHAIELEVGGDLWMAARIDAPFDLMNVQSPLEYARRCVDNDPSPRMSPLRCAEVLDGLAGKTIRLRDEAKAKGGSGPEFEASCGDLEMLALLGRYHGARLRTATYFSLYTIGHDPAVEKATRDEHAIAVELWRQLSVVGEKYYRPFLEELRMHTENFTWTGEAKSLAQGGFPIGKVLDPLDSEVMRRCESRGLTLDVLKPKGDGIGPSIEGVSIDLGDPVDGVRHLTVSARVFDTAGIRSVALRWKPFPSESSWRTTPMHPDGKGVYRGALDVFPHGAMWGIEALDTDGNGTQWPDFIKGIPYRWIEPWPDPTSFAPPAAEALASGLASDRDRFRALAIGRRSEVVTSLDDTAKASILEAVAEGTLLYIDCQDFTQFPLDWLPGKIRRVNETAETIALTPGSDLFKGLPSELKNHKIVAGTFCEADDGWTVLGDPPAIAVRRHGQGWIVLNQVQLFYRDPVTGWLGMETYASLRRLIENIFALSNKPETNLPVLVLDPGEGTMIDILSCVNIRTTVCDFSGAR